MTEEEKGFHGQIDGLTFLLGELLASLPKEQRRSILDRSRIHLMKDEGAYTEGWQSIHQVIETMLPV